MMHSRKMHTFRDTGGIDLAEQSSSAKNAERMLKREPRKNLLSGTTEWNRELGGYEGGLPTPTATSTQARTAEEKGLYLGKYTLARGETESRYSIR